MEYSDFYGKPFNDVLRMIVEYIDKKVDKTVGITQEAYQELQKWIRSVYPKNAISTRKSINQFFKFGFIHNFGKGYHYLTREFLEATDEEQKRLLLSRIVYDNASFSRSLKNPSDLNEMKFLIKTLEACEKISKDELLAVMFTDITTVEKGFLTPKELRQKYAEILIDETAKRKYNQRNYLFNVCAKLTDIYAYDNVLSLDKRTTVDHKEKSKVRDPYLQRLYKIQLINEYKKVYCAERGKCVMERLAYPVLIASHIKPYAVCDEEEAFHVDNGLLLSKNMDSLFDNGYITFDEQGKVVTSPLLDGEVAKYVQKFALDGKTFHQGRKKFMQYHREHVFKAK